MAFDDRFDDRPRRRKHAESFDGKTGFAGASALHGVPIQCQYCSGQAFRRSTLRGDDFFQMLLMRYPVRCLRCSQRQGVSFTVAGVSLSSKDRPKRPSRNTPITGAWTEPAQPVGTTGDSDSVEDE